jgi:hypothetical protein
LDASRDDTYFAKKFFPPSQRSLLESNRLRIIQNATPSMLKFERKPLGQFSKEAKQRSVQAILAADIGGLFRVVRRVSGNNSYRQPVCARE